ncbi:adhesion G protein-coupled receptor B1-like isoform X2 [Magallana gigas]|uniref:adhesion G protein-coupled receptor B1-like isoform X2 n=1 Tax=Magallana gigas TaxID=29159 RepID=UPI00333F8218
MMKNLTSLTNEISAGDLSSSLDILEMIVHVSNSTGSHIEKKAFYDVIDNVLSTNNTKSWTTVSEQTEKDASSLLRSMERLSEVVIQNHNITSTQFTGSNFELSIDNRKIDETGIRFPDVASTNDSENVEERSTYLELPKQEAKVEKAINYVAVIYKTMSEIMTSDSKRDQNGEKQEDTFREEEFVNSQILSLTTQSDLGVLVPPLNLTFRHIQNNKPAEMQVLCVSWNFTDSEWTEEGCKVNHSDHETTVCQCNHLTNFAILMRPYSPVAEDEQSLKTMSLVGVILSVTFTAITLLIYILTWKNIKSEQNIIMLNLCGSLILAYVIFISAVEQTSNKGVCIAITATLHYLFLVTFFSMLGMGVYYFMSITVTYYAMYVANNFKSKSRGHWFLLGIWGIPVLITVTSLGAFWGENYHLKSYCWLSMESGSLYAFIVPVCVIAILNLLVIVSLVRVLCASSAMTKSSLQKKAISGLRSLGTLLPVLGVTWLFGILAVNENANVFQYIFVITNSFQVMQGLKNKYPAFSSLISIAEHSKKETSSISRDTSTSATNVQLIKIKKRSIFDGLRRLTTTIKNIEEKDFESLVTEKTISTDCSLSVSHEKTLVESQNTSKLEPEAGKASTERRFRFSINLNPWTKRYRVAQM